MISGIINGFCDLGKLFEDGIADVFDKPHGTSTVKALRLRRPSANSRSASDCSHAKTNQRPFVAARRSKNNSCSMVPATRLPSKKPPTLKNEPLQPRRLVGRKSATADSNSSKRPSNSSSSNPSPSRIPQAFKPVNKPVWKKRVTASDLSIDASRCDMLVVAIAELETCKEIFGGWAAQLDLVSPRRGDRLELGVVAAVDKLNDDTTAALHSSYHILSTYRALVRLMDQRLVSISRLSGGGDLFGGNVGKELSRLSASVSNHSSALSNHVKQIQEHMRALVSDVEKTKEKADRRALRRKIWHWIVRVLQALSFLISGGGTILSLIHPVGLLGSVGIAVTSTLAAAVAKLCELVEGKFSDTAFDSIIGFLRSEVPEAAKAAELSLTTFQACHRILKLEMEVRQGEKSAWLSATDAGRARDGWKAAETRLHIREAKATNFASSPRV